MPHALVSQHVVVGHVDAKRPNLRRADDGTSVDEGRARSQSCGTSGGGHLLSVRLKQCSKPIFTDNDSNPRAGVGRAQTSRRLRYKDAISQSVPHRLLMSDAVNAATNRAPKQRRGASSWWCAAGGSQRVIEVRISDDPSQREAALDDFGKGRGRPSAKERGRRLLRARYRRNMHDGRPTATCSARRLPAWCGAKQFYLLRRCGVDPRATRSAAVAKIQAGRTRGRNSRAGRHLNELRRDQHARHLGVPLVRRLGPRVSLSPSRPGRRPTSPSASSS